MELRIPLPKFIFPKWQSRTLFPPPNPNRRYFVSWRASSPAACLSLEQIGGKRVVELVGAFNKLTGRINVLSTSSSRLLFKSLKLSIPILQALPLAADGRAPLSKALSLALLLAHLQMDAEVISAGLLRQVLVAGAMSVDQIKDLIGTGTAHLLHESLRMKNIPSKVEVLDDESAAALRKFCFTFYDIRAGKFWTWLLKMPDSAGGAVLSSSRVTYFPRGGVPGLKPLIPQMGGEIS